MVEACTSSALPATAPIGTLVRETNTGIYRQRTGEFTWLEVGRRVRLSRAPGARMAAGAVKIDRSTRWGNPWQIEKIGGIWTVRHDKVAARAFFGADEFEARQFAITMVRESLLRPARGGLTFTLPEVVLELRGRTLACWCGLDQDCHGDVYVELANR